MVWMTAPPPPSVSGGLDLPLVRRGLEFSLAIKGMTPGYVKESIGK